MIPLYDLAAQQHRLRDELSRRTGAVYAHGKYILGPEVAELEERLAAYVGVAHCITCANGTDALQIALMALGVGQGDEVITPSFSYIAAAEAIALLGAKPVYVEIDADSFLIDVDAVAAAITVRTKAIVAVSLYGQPADFTALNRIAAAGGITVIEDGAQSFGATQDGKRSGALSQIGCTSFFPTKPLGCYGDGGAIFTNDDSLATAIRCVARHGQKERYHHLRVGINSRLDTLQAAILLAKLDIADDEREARQRIADVYDTAFTGSVVTRPRLASANDSAWSQYTVRVKNRDGVKCVLQDMGIESAVYYPRLLHRQPAVVDDAVKLPVSERAVNEVLSVPIHAYMSDDDVHYVIETLLKASL